MAEHTESSTVVAAPADRVMEVIADLPAYPEWNDEVREVEVLETGEGGRPRRVRFVLDAGAVRDQYVLAYAWEPRTVRWSLVEGQVLKAMEGSYALHERDGGTEVVYRLSVDVKIPMLGMIKRKAEKVIVERALAGLRERAERPAGQPPAGA